MLSSCELQLRTPDTRLRLEFESRDAKVHIHLNVYCVIRSMQSNIMNKADLSIDFKKCTSI